CSLRLDRRRRATPKSLDLRAYRERWSSMGLSRRAYARHRGVAENAVRKAIASGRITLEADGTIDPEKADRDWTARTDPSQQRGAHSSRADNAAAQTDHGKSVPRAAIDAVQKALRDSGTKPE